MGDFWPAHIDGDGVGGEWGWGGGGWAEGAYCMTKMYTVYKWCIKKII